MFNRSIARSDFGVMQHIWANCAGKLVEVLELLLTFPMWISLKIMFPCRNRNAETKQKSSVVILTSFSHEMCVGTHTHTKTPYGQNMHILFTKSEVWFSSCTPTNTHSLGSRKTWWPGTRVEPEFSIKGHYCQTLEWNLPAVRWLPMYLLLQFNYGLDNMTHHSHSIWQYAVSDIRNRGQLVE